MILDKVVAVKGSRRTESHYVALGYRAHYHRKIDKINNISITCPRNISDYEFTIKVEDLLPGSNIIIRSKCDCCGIEFKREFKEIFRSPYFIRNKQTMCIPCAIQPKNIRRLKQPVPTIDDLINLVFKTK